MPYKKFQRDSIPLYPRSQFHPKTIVGRFAQTLKVGESYLCLKNIGLEAAKHGIVKRGLRAVTRVEYDKAGQIVGTRVFAALPKGEKNEP